MIDGLIGEALAQDTAERWLAKLKAVGVPCGRINTVAQALDDPHTAARRMVETVTHPTIGELKMLGIPFKFSDTPAAVAARAAARSASTPTRCWESSGWTRPRSRSCGEKVV